MGKALQRYVPSPCMEMHRHLLHSDVSGGGIVQAEYQVEMHPCKGSHFINTDKMESQEHLTLSCSHAVRPEDDDTNRNKSMFVGVRYTFHTRANIP